MENDYLTIPEDKEKQKSIKVSYEVWKVLSQYKLDTDKDKFEDVIKELLENVGY